MIARTRGEHDCRRARAWRPGQTAVTTPEPAADLASSEPALGTGVEVLVERSPGSPFHRRLWLAVAMLAAAALASALSPTGRASRPVAAAPPGTPRAGFDAYMAAAVDDPARVCRVRFSPRLAASYRHTSSGSCERYFADVTDTAVRIQRIVESHATAIVELRQAHGARYRWQAILSRHAGGWRAVGLTGGR